MYFFMQLYSTKNPEVLFSLKEAVLKGLPDDNGLFVPNNISALPASFFERLPELAFPELAYEVAKHLFEGSIPEPDLKEIITKSINFPAPLIKLNEQTSVLELFHGPSLAFKDFGARFMAQLMGYFNKGEEKDLIILVATSGDTGGAVAAGFHNTPGIKVVTLYPSGRVSPLQEKQLTTLGGNISAIEIEGSFDDCQALVKKAFLDKSLTENIRLSSANSINIARLIPQSFYYFEAYKQLGKNTKPPVFIIPSGNFGNLTAGLLAKKMGLPIAHFIAATNKNDIVPSYLSSGKYKPKPSLATISNAMDVGAPSNFYRMVSFYMDHKAPVSLETKTWGNMKKDISGYGFDDTTTQEAMKRGYTQFNNYVFEPHGAVGLLAWEAYLKENTNVQGIILETAHPSKFLDVVEKVLKIKVEVPERLARLADKKKEATLMASDYESFKSYLEKHFY
ncbi:MAG: threonine synthase [Polaribacter sp.]|jgi:threonine synthase